MFNTHWHLPANQLTNEQTSAVANKKNKVCVRVLLAFY